MIKRNFLLLGIFLMVVTVVKAQQNDPVLFTVENTPVHQSEFVYIYSKTNGEKADFSKKSLDEYLDLYIKFKLKVQKAKALRLDTIPQLKNELAGYRRQLADSYLIDKEVTDKLIREAYDHSTYDVDISHILIAVKQDPTADEEKAAYDKAMAAKQRIAKGEDFAAVAKEVSDDKSAAKNGGHIGYVTALFPKGFYQLEVAAYKQPLKTLSDPIRTDIGYHILKVNEKRPARGEIEAAHILLRSDETNGDQMKKRIDSIYQALKAGADFETLAKTHSQDSRTAPKGGYIGFFGINKFTPDFEGAAFALTSDGEISQPFQSSVGWHIVKRISRPGIQPYDISKSRLEGLVKADPRFEASKTAMVEKIKKEGNLKEYPSVREEYAATLNDTFLTFRWKPVKSELPDKTLLTLGSDFKVSLVDFVDYMERASRKRIRKGADISIPEVVNELYADFLNENCMKFEETQLEKKYPDFKSLMREYEEGILLFEATKMLIWDKASKDTVGLADFYQKIYGKYRWEPRAVTSIYRLNKSAADQIAAVRDFAASHGSSETLEKFNTGEIPVLSVEKKTFERSRNPDLKGMEWKAGALSQTEDNAKNQVLKFLKIEEILPESMKTLDEARGYVVADYQDYLEEQWVEQLRNEYSVKVDQKVFDKMVKK
ncbi:MAG TPA: peptidylprolyl isomerase [Saprospiraceae bacterium]|nr:peptidylprolyl isomerase [Saprospiraceae bacterium]HMQ82008.1 peptidylprolyl isomerase [Saprospiraceae bacterium]